MLVLRFHATVKRGRHAEAIQLLKDSGDQMPSVSEWRIFEPVVGDNDVITFDLWFENMEELSAFIAELNSPEGQDGLKDWYEVTTGVTNELLNVVG